jgi:PTS system ascorbate-specific IIA component
MVRIAIIAHEPMASALLDVGLHVFPDATDIYPFDIQANCCPDTVSELIFDALYDFEAKKILVLTDLYGATPSNISERVVTKLNEKGVAAELICGVNAGMVISAIAYRLHDLPELSEKVIERGKKGIRSLIAPPAEQLSAD